VKFAACAASCPAPRKPSGRRITWAGTPSPGWHCCGWPRGGHRRRRPPSRRPSRLRRGTGLPAPDCARPR
jgi:hypothetical protein